MAFFPLKFRATIERKSSETDRSGQAIESYSVLEDDVKCLYLATSGTKNVTGREQFKTLIAFYVEPNSQIEEGDRVINIRTSAGAVIEPGPFEVESAKRVPNHITGTLHHISVKLAGRA